MAVARKPASKPATPEAKAQKFIAKADQPAAKRERVMVTIRFDPDLLLGFNTSPGRRWTTRSLASDPAITLFGVAFGASLSVCAFYWLRSVTEAAKLCGLGSRGSR
jgi:hypothetical protein